MCAGVDAGGTWLRLQAAVRPIPAAEPRRPPVRQGAHGPRAAPAAPAPEPRRGARQVTAAARVTAVPDLASFVASVWRRHGWRPGDVAVLVVASRALWTPAECRAMARGLRHLARRVVVIPDAQAAALGALEHRPGVLVLAGTGSIVVAHNGRGRWMRAGGFGPFLGDEGSGFWLGREWLRATVDDADFEAVRAFAHAPRPAAAIAALAPDVIARARRGDRRARAIVRTGQARLAAAAAGVARRLRLVPPLEVSWAGSVMGDAWFRAGVAAALARDGVRARWTPPTTPPVTAALRLALDLARSG